MYFIENLNFIINKLIMGIAALSLITGIVCSIIMFVQSCTAITKYEIKIRKKNEGKRNNKNQG